MELKNIQQQLISKFDFDKTVEFLNNNNIDIKKEELIQTANLLIENLYNEEDKEYSVTQSGYLKVKREYLEKEVNYSLHLDIGVDAGIYVKIDD